MNEIIQGKITKFAGNGRILGYPTANISTETELLDGVYFGKANLDEYKNYPTLIFVGTPTTVGDTDRRVEAHLLDILDKDHYGSNIELTVLYFHRPNQKFASVDELKIAMKDDEKAAREWFKKR